MEAIKNLNSNIEIHKWVVLTYLFHFFLVFKF